MAEYTVWQVPDRDSPQLLAPGRQLEALLGTEGYDGHSEDAVLEATGLEVKRPRRWHVMFERMGLLFRDDGTTKLTEFGRMLRDIPYVLRQGLAQAGARVAIRYQLRNPADAARDPDNSYPGSADIHPYWAILKAADSLDGRIHWDEINRELMTLMKDSEVPAAIERIRSARAEPGYDPVQGGTEEFPLRPRAHEAAMEGPEDRDPIGQLRDQRLTPFLKRAGMAELLLESEGDGYWAIPRDVRGIVHAAVESHPPFKNFETEPEWFAYLGATGDTAESNQPAAYGGANVLYFGPPGTGKSHLVAAASEHAVTHRTVFHPEYSYADFVGAYKPVTGSDASEDILAADGMTVRSRPVVYYDFEPGIFATALVDALKRPDTPVVLIIEEINRGDCAAIFGDLFQLLDRDESGASQYPIRPQRALGQFMFESTVLATPDDAIRIPANLSLFATMNTSDQALFPMDAAFKRRWKWRAVSIDSGTAALVDVEVEHRNGHATLWLDLIGRINAKVVELGLSEDKRIGPWYLKSSNGLVPFDEVREKLLFYLWHDVFRNHRRAVFSDEARSFDELQTLMDRGDVRAALGSLFDVED